jgi:transaldolase
LEEARRLWAKVDRDNVMIKVPATPAGIPAIEQLISEGINVNVTLMFSLEHYVRVAEAYVRGLQARARNGKPLAVGSVASFFVSRVDSLIDKQLEERLARSTNANEKQKLQSLLGKTAIANSRIVYQKFKEIFGRRAFLDLKEKGARVQRPLWASTSTKNPKYRDVLYAEELIGRDTVDTMPPATIDAFRDHGKVRVSLEESLEEADSVFRSLSDLGIDMAAATEKLQVDGVKLFADSFDTLMNSLASKRESLAK